MFSVDPAFSVYGQAGISTDQEITFTTGLEAYAHDFNIKLAKVCKKSDF
jgi:hypothetical protein